MSIQSLSAVVARSTNIKLNTVAFLIRNFSRRSNSSTEGPFKVVKPRKPPKDNKLAWRDPSFELLAPTSDFPFFLPGHVGVAWYDTQTTIQTRHEFIMEQIENDSKTDANIICRVQVCPTVLRQTVCDLFPYRNFDNSDLSVVTISLKPDLKRYRKNKEIETEKMAQTFLLTARNICDKLRTAGYWADFINPFSGRPYLCPTSASNLYETDEKFRCLDFQIFEIMDCKVISNEENKTRNNFVASLFTNAPSKKNNLNNIFVR